MSGGTASPTTSVLKSPSPTDPRSLEQEELAVGKDCVSSVYFQRPVLRQKCSPRLGGGHLGVPGHSQLCMMISTAQEMWLCLGVGGPNPYFTEDSFDPLSERFNNLPGAIQFTHGSTRFKPCPLYHSASQSATSTLLHYLP